MQLPKHYCWVIAALLLGYIIYLKRKKVLPASKAIDVRQFPLKKGSSGKEVRQLQKYLIAEHGTHFLPEGVTAAFDTQTLSAVHKILNRDNISLKAFVGRKIYNY
jgi:hypothetical protein